MKNCQLEVNKSIKLRHPSDYPLISSNSLFGIRSQLVESVRDINEKEGGRRRIGFWSFSSQQHIQGKFLERDTLAIRLGFLRMCVYPESSILN